MWTVIACCKNRRHIWASKFCSKADSWKPHFFCQLWRVCVNIRWNDCCWSSSCCISKFCFIIKLTMSFYSFKDLVSFNTSYFLCTDWKCLFVLPQQTKYLESHRKDRTRKPRLSIFNRDKIWTKCGSEFCHTSHGSARKWCHCWKQWFCFCVWYHSTQMSPPVNICKLFFVPFV